ncbi:MAG: type IV pilus assembly protein PilM [Magnetococcales bacterium]|nr:type IV pilus assembly protein PilM [Magnetococcales bacterium]
MLTFFSGNKTTIGLDIGTTAIRAVEIRPAGKGWRLHRWGTQPLPPESMADGKVKNSEQVVSALQALFEKTGFSSKQVAISVGGPSVIIKNIQLPFMTEMELEDQISLEAEEHIPFGIDDVHLDFHILNREEEQINVLLTACKTEVLDDHLKVVAEAGLTASICDLDLCALINAQETFVSSFGGGVKKKRRKKAGKESEPEGEEPVICLVNSGGSCLNVAILIGSVPAFTRDYIFGTRQMIKQISQELEIPFDQAELLLPGGGSPEQAAVVQESLTSFESQLVSTIGQALDFYRTAHSKQPVTQLYLSGPCGQIPDLDKRLTASLSLPVTISDPLTTLKQGKGKGCRPMPHGISTRFMVALGLALRGREA